MSRVPAGTYYRRMFLRSLWVLSVMLLMSYYGNSPMGGSAREGGFSGKLSHRLHVIRQYARTSVDLPLNSLDCTSCRRERVALGNSGVWRRLRSCETP